MRHCGVSPRSRFQSTLSVRRATRFSFCSTVFCRFQSTLSVRRATRHLRSLRPLQMISIHALRKESDLLAAPFRPHLWRFQSTLSVRRATDGNNRKGRDGRHFNPRSP